MEQKQKLALLLEQITEAMSIEQFSAKLRKCADYAEDAEEWLYLELFLTVISAIPEEMLSQEVVLWQQNQEYQEIASKNSSWAAKRTRHYDIELKNFNKVVGIDYTTFIKDAHCELTDVDCLIKISFDGIVVFVKGPMKMLSMAKEEGILDKVVFLWPED